MTSVTFKIKEIKGTDPVVVVEVDGEISIKNEKIKIIQFAGQAMANIKTKINGKAGKSFKLTYDDGEVEIEKGGRTFTANRESKSAGPGASAKMAGSAGSAGLSASASVAEEKVPNKLIVEQNETLRVIFNDENGSIKLAPSDASEDNQEDKDQEDKDQEDKDQEDKDQEDKDQEDKDQEDKKTKNPSATPEETTAKNELEAAEASGDKDKINAALEKYEETVQKSSDADLAKTY